MQSDSYLDELDPKEFIVIKRARVNNLKNLSVAIPRNKLVVITGLSGSGKSSLAFDTLFAEGQRMYVESLSSYARQFLGRMEKPEVDYIRGVSPAIAIEQKVNTRNPRSTVGTTTEIYDYLKLLFARIGKTVSPISGKEVRRDSVTDVVDALNKFKEGTRVMVACPLKIQKGRKMEDELSLLLSKGFARILVNGEVQFIEELLNPLELSPQGISLAGGEEKELKKNQLPPKKPKAPFYPVKEAKTLKSLLIVPPPTHTMKTWLSVFPIPCRLHSLKARGTALFMQRVTKNFTFPTASNWTA